MLRIKNLFLAIWYTEEDWPLGEKTVTIPFHYCKEFNMKVYA